MLRASESRVLINAAVLIAVSLGSNVSAQERWSRGQNIQPVFEGWERNADGSFSMVFGYLNRNYEEQPVVAVGPDNSLEPGPADRGQPTHFYNRRQQFAFTVRVPADWGDKDLVWTVTHNGRTDRAFGHLWPVWEIDAGVRLLNRGAGNAQGFADNQRPFIAIDVADDLEVTLPGVARGHRGRGRRRCPATEPEVRQAEAAPRPEIAGRCRPPQRGNHRTRGHVASLARTRHGDLRRPRFRRSARVGERSHRLVSASLEHTCSGRWPMTPSWWPRRR